MCPAEHIRGLAYSVVTIFMSDTNIKECVQAYPRFAGSSGTIFAPSNCSRTTICRKAEDKGQAVALSCRRSCCPGKAAGEGPRSPGLEPTSALTGAENPR